MTEQDLLEKVVDKFSAISNITIMKGKAMLLDGRSYDELIMEQHGSVCWLHFAVRPKDNRRRIAFLKA